MIPSTPIVTAWPEVEEYSFDHFAVSDGIAWLMGHSLKNILAIFVGLFGAHLRLRVLFTSIAGAFRAPRVRELRGLRLAQPANVHDYRVRGAIPALVLHACADGRELFLGILYTAVLTSVFMAHLMTPKAHWKVSDDGPPPRPDDPTRRQVFSRSGLYSRLAGSTTTWRPHAAAVLLQAPARPPEGEIKGALTRDLKLASGSVIVRGSMWFFQHVVAAVAALRQDRRDWK